MPHWASCRTLEVLSVRAERVQDIDRTECIREGFESDPPKTWIHVPNEREKFAESWNKAHGAGSWERNGWVWRVEFKVRTQ